LLSWSFRVPGNSRFDDAHGDRVAFATAHGGHRVSRSLHRKEIGMSRVRACALAVVAAAGALLGTTGSSAAAGAEVGLSPNGGTVAYGYISQGMGPNSPLFEVMLGVPAAGAASEPGGVNLAQPWALFREWITSPTTGTSAGVACSTESNPASWALQTGSGPARASFDTTCNDGSPYAFYRVTLQQWGPSWESSYVSPLEQQWGAMAGNPAQAAVTGEQGASYAVANLQMCGYLKTAATAASASPWVCGDTGGYGFITPMVTMTTLLFDQ
jgi:hypothetical protein